MTGKDLYLAYMAELSKAHAVLHSTPFKSFDWEDLPADKQDDYNGRADGANLMGMGDAQSVAKAIHANSKAP